MRSIGNIIWLVFGGLVSAISYSLAGIIFMLTIVGIPYGMCLFKLASVVLTPFNYQITYQEITPNILTLIFSLVFLPVGFFLMLFHMLVGMMFCLTIVGIPFGLQFFKVGKLSLLPLLAKVKYL